MKTATDPSVFAAIEQHKRVFGKPVLIVRPGVSLTLYSATGLKVLAPHVADALEAYLSWFPEVVLDAQLGTDRYKAFGSAALKRLLAQLRSVPDDHEFLEVHLKDGIDAQCGRYAFHFEATPLTDGDKPLETNLIVFEWPLTMGLDATSAELIIAFCKELMAMVPISSGNCGFAFQHPQTFPTECLDAIQRLMPRFSGFEPSYRRCRFRMRGHLPTAQWLMLVGADMAASYPKLLPETLRATFGDSVDVIDVGTASVIKAAELPVLGDSNRPGDGLSSIPQVARALRPWRYQISGFGGQLVDAAAWLSRFDNCL